MRRGDTLRGNTPLAPDAACYNVNGFAGTQRPWPETGS